jgi:GNAT superfamily N-acetyltransferase
MTSDPATVRIRELRAEDIDALRALAHTVWHAHYPTIISVAQIDYMLAERYSPEVLRAELASDLVYWDLLWRGAELAAFASSLLTEIPEEMKLDKIYVHPEHQRCGYGGMLIERTLARCRAQGRSRLVLAVNKRNHSAIAAYHKHGFSTERAVIKNIGGGFVMDDYIMVRSV